MDCVAVSQIVFAEMVNSVACYDQIHNMINVCPTNNIAVEDTSDMHVFSSPVAAPTQATPLHSSALHIRVLDSSAGHTVWLSTMDRAQLWFHLSTMDKSFKSGLISAP